VVLGLSVTEPLVSVVCVTEDRPEMMPWLVWNWRRQTCEDAELIVVDSSASMNAHDVEMMLMGVPRLRLCRAERPATIGKKTNIGTQLARGRYVMFWGDDDWQHPERTTRALAVMQAHEGECEMLSYRVAYFAGLRERRVKRYRQGGNAPVVATAAVPPGMAPGAQPIAARPDPLVLRC